MSILIFPAILGATQSFEVASSNGTLGDGLDQLSLPIARIVEDSWQLTSVPLKTTDKDALVTTLRDNVAKGALWRLRESSFNTHADFNVYQWEFERDKQGLYEWENWTTTPIGGEWWQVELTLNRTGHQEIDECLLRPTDLAETYPLFPLNLYMSGAKNSFESKFAQQRMRGGIEERRRLGFGSTRDSWQFTATIHEYKKNEVCDFLKDRCGNFFEFRLVPGRAGKIYTCEKWSIKQIGRDYWELSVEFKRSFLPFRPTDIKRITDLFDFYGTQEEIIEVMDATFADVDEKIAGLFEWVTRLTRDIYPFMLNLLFLLPNAFHTVLGRGGYFPPSAGVTEGQAIFVRAAMLAYFATGFEGWLNLAIAGGNALLEYFYPLKIPGDWTPATGIRVPHWLINIKSPFVAKGLPAPDPLNMGHFNVVVDFVNGEGYIPTGAPFYGELLANVFRVHPVSDSLLWKNIYARPLGGYSYPIDYWVTNQMMQGTIKRQFADTESNNGREPIPTNEPTGKIKLSTPYAGQAKVVYLTYTGGVIGVGVPFEAYPGWRGLRKDESMGALDVFTWLHQSYLWLFQVTQDTRWLTALQCNLYTFEQARNVINPTSWYEKSDSPEPFAYPGSQAILANFDPNQIATSTRVTSGEKKDWLQIDVPLSPLPFPSAELQNFAVKAKMNPESAVFVEAACSVATELEVVLSLSPNAFDFSQYYIARLPVPAGGVPVARTFTTREFLLWDTTQTSWYPHNADNPVYEYEGLGGRAAASRDTQEIDGIPRSVWKLNLNKDDGFAGAGFVLIHAKPRFPLQIYLKHTGDDVRLAVTVDNEKFFYKVEATDGWTRLRLDSDLFKKGDEKPDGSFISGIEFEANGESRTWVWWVGSPPRELPAPCQTFKATLVSRVPIAHTLYVGNFSAVNSPSDVLPYTPGVCPYTCNVVSDGKGGQAISAWQGTIPMVGYQDPEFEVERGDWVAVDNILQFFLDSQAAYKEQSTSRTNGYFMPGYVWNMWSSGEYTSNGEINVFSNTVIDPNNSWSPYSFRALRATARAWRRMVDQEFPGNIPPNLDELIAKAKKVTMDFLNALSADYVKRRNVSAITDFPANADPQVRYTEPHASALIADAALHANIALNASGTKSGLSTTLRVLKATYNHMQNEWVSEGAMSGSFTKSQPTFIGDDGLEYRWNFGFWVFEELFFLADLKLLQHRIGYPQCVYFIRP
jgi:phage-related protein